MTKNIKTDEKIKWICKKAYEQFITIGINEFILNKFISSIGMSKGQFYYYFKTKEELIYKVMDLKGYEVIEKTIEKVSKEEEPFEKILAFFFIYLNEEDEFWKSFNKLMQETLHLYVSERNSLIKKMNSDFYSYLFETFENIIEELINDKHLKEEAKIFPKSIIATADGMFFHAIRKSDYSLKENLHTYLLSMYKLLKA